MSNNIRLIITNVHDDATLTATSEATPAEYTQRSGRSYVWRSSSTATQVITASLSTASYLDAVVVYSHNLSTNGSVRIEYLLGGSVVYDSGEIIAADLIPLGIFQVGIDPWGERDLSELPTVQYNVWTDSTLADAYRITLTDPANPDGYLQVSRIFAGSAYSPEYNPSYGLRLEWQDFSENRRTESGSLRTVGSGMARRLSFDLTRLAEVGLTQLSRELLRNNKGDDIYISVYPERGGQIEAEHSFIARRAVNYSHSQPAYCNWQSSLEFEEV